MKADRVAAILDVSRAAVHNAIRAGRIPSLRIDRSVRIPTHQFLATFFPEALDVSAESDTSTNGVALTSANGAGSHTFSQVRGDAHGASEAA